jgi:hypothetical protein
MFRSRCSQLLAALLLTTGALATAGSAHADAPSNDSFATATVLTGTSAATTGSNVSATTEPYEPLRTSWQDPVSSTLWFRWTAPITADYSISTLGSDFDTTLNVFTGSSLPSLITVAMDDDAYGSDTATTQISSTGFAATAGTTYNIQVGGTGNSPTGTVDLAISTAAVAGTMTFGPATANSDPDPLEGCIGFYQDASRTTAVASGCATGNHSSTITYALGSLPAGTYFLDASDDDTYFTDPLTVTIPGGDCTLTGLGVNFANQSWTPPTGKDCSTAPACLIARAALPTATTTLSAAQAAESLAEATKRDFWNRTRAVQAKIRAAKRHHRPTRGLNAQLRIWQPRYVASVPRLTAARQAESVASAAEVAAQAAVRTACGVSPAGLS